MTDWSPYSKFGGHTNIAKIGGPLNYGLAATADNQAYTLSVATPKLENGDFVVFKMPNAASAGAATLNVNGLTAKNMYHAGKITSQIGAADLEANGVYIAVYDTSLNTSAGGWLIYGVRPSVPATGWTGGTNATAVRSFDCNNGTLDELYDIVATLIADLKALRNPPISA